MMMVKSSVWEPDGAVVYSDGDSDWNGKLWSDAQTSTGAGGDFDLGVSTLVEVPAGGFAEVALRCGNYAWRAHDVVVSGDAWHVDDATVGPMRQIGSDGALPARGGMSFAWVGDEFRIRLRNDAGFARPLALNLPCRIAI